ncbi:MAG: hypothetical protein U9Q92_05155 [archaeon]|nr:hypothetical protein [archaeon]
MNPKTILMIIILLLASGCPQQSVDFSANAGAVVQDLSFDMPKVYTGDTATLMFDVVNAGGKEIPVDGVKVYVYGPKISSSGGWGLKTSSPEATSAEGYISASVSSDALPPPNPSLGTPGGRQSFDLEFSPAVVNKGLEVPTEFHVSLCYPYATEVISQIEVVSKNELRATKAAGSRKDSVNAGGPIHISVEVENNMVAGRKIPVILRVTDVGNGYPMLRETSCNIDTGTEDRHKITLAVTVDGKTDIECKYDTGTGETSKGTVTLTRGKGALFCVYDTPEADAPRRTYMVRATAEYKYYTTSTVTITNVGSSL